MLGRMDSGAAEPILLSADANASAQAAEGAPGVRLPGTPSSAGRKSLAGRAADAADPASGGAALGDARNWDAVAKDSVANLRTPCRPHAPAHQAGGLPQATLSRRPKGAMPQPVGSQVTSAAPPSPTFLIQAETIPAPSPILVNAVVPPAATPPNIATGTPAAIVTIKEQSWRETSGSPQSVTADLPVAAAQALPGMAGVEGIFASGTDGMPPSVATGSADRVPQAGIAAAERAPANEMQGRSLRGDSMMFASAALQTSPDAQPGAPADPSSTAEASPDVVAGPSAAIMGPRGSIAFAMQAYGLQGAANPATSTKTGNTASAADASAGSSLGEPVFGQAAAPLPGGPNQASQAASLAGAPLQDASGTGGADANGLAAPPGRVPPHPEVLAAHGLALPASPVVVRVTSPVQSTQATRSDPAKEADHAPSEPEAAARAGDAPGPAGATIALPGQAGAALGMSNGAVPVGGNTATGQPPQVAAVLPGMPAAQRNASQAQPGHAARAPLGHDGRDMSAGSSDQMPSAGAGAAGPEAVAVSPMFPEAANPGAEAARLAAAAGPALMGATSPARPAFAQTASAAGGADAASAPPAMQQVVQFFAAPNLPQRMTLQLAPAELGAVQIGIERAPDGPATVTLLVERADTLLLLMRDQPALHRALDAAGLAAEGRTLHFGLAQPGPASTATTPGPASAGGSGPASFGSGRDGSAPSGSQAGGSQGGGSQGGGQGRGGYQPSAESGSGRPSARIPQRAGVDFTA